MEARVYGDGKIVPDTTFAKINKELNINEYKYSIVIKINDDKALLGDIFFITNFDENSKIIGHGTGGSLLNNGDLYGINNSIYLKFIPQEYIPNKKFAFYLTVEYEKNRKIEYYCEMIKKVEGKKFIIYFKSYPPKKILNAKNKYIKE